MAKKKAAAAKKTRRAPRTADLSYIEADLRPLAVPIGDLVPDPENANKHNDGSLTAIVASLRKYGQRKPIVVNRRTMEVEAGNGTLQAMQYLKRDHIAVVFVEDDNATARGYSIADNRTAQLSEWDLDLLLPQIDMLEDEDDDLVAELALDDLRPKPEAEGGAADGVDIPTAHQVVIECKSEDEQKKLYDEFKQRGFGVRLLTM